VYLLYRTTIFNYYGQSAVMQYGRIS